MAEFRVHRAKALDALWHADQKRWVVPQGLDITPFALWLESSDRQR